MKTIKILYRDQGYQTKEFPCSPLCTVGNLILRVKLRYSYHSDVYDECEIVDATGKKLEIWESETIKSLVHRTNSQCVFYEKKILQDRK